MRAGRFARAELTALMPDYGKEKGPWHLGIKAPRHQGIEAARRKNAEIADHASSFVPYTGVT